MPSLRIRTCFALIAFLLFLRSGISGQQINSSETLFLHSGVTACVSDGAGGFITAIWNGQPGYMYPPGIDRWSLSGSIQRMDSSGTVLWSISVYPASFGGDQFIRTHDGNFLYTNIEYDNCYMEWYANMTAVKFDLSGSVMWANNYFTWIDNYPDYFEVAERVPGEFWATGNGVTHITIFDSLSLINEIELSPLGGLWDIEFDSADNEYIATNAGIANLDSSLLLQLLHPTGSPVTKLFLRNDSTLFYVSGDTLFSTDTSFTNPDTLAFTGWFSSAPVITSVDTGFWMVTHNLAVLIKDDFTVVSSVTLNSAPNIWVKDAAVDNDQILIVGEQYPYPFSISARQSFTHDGSAYSPGTSIKIKDVYITGAVYGYFSGGPGYPYVAYDMKVTVENDGTDTISYFVHRVKLRGSMSGGMCSVNKLHLESYATLAPGDTFMFDHGHIVDYPTSPLLYAVEADVSSPNHRLDGNLSGNVILRSPGTILLATSEPITDVFSFTLSPNPAQDAFSLAWPADAGLTADITICNLNGSVVRRTDHVMPGVQISVQGFPSGLYLITAETSSGVMRGRLVKL